jgi:apyrase
MSSFLPVARCALVVSMVASAIASTSYGIVVDAGSSGSRLHVYSWPTRDFLASNLPPPDITIPIDLEIALTTTPGIDTSQGVQNLAAIVAQAKQLSIFAADSDLVAKTPIYLKATAGLRILSASQRNVQLAAVRSMLRGSGFLFTSDAQARVISGEEEGVYGWITVNYMKGTLKKAAPGTLTGTYGALDLGGASTQITFLPADLDVLANSFILNLNSIILEELYTHSFLYFGQNEALTRAKQAALYQAWSTYPTLPAPATVNFPCNFQGLSQNFTDPFTGVTTTMVGTGDLASCRNSIIGSLLDKRAVCLTVPRPNKDQNLRALAAMPSPAPAVNASAPGCSLSGVYQPPPTNIRFMAFSGFTYVWNELGMPATGGTLQTFSNRVDSLCGLPWSTAKAQYPGVSPKYLQAYCFLGAFSVGMLVDGYGMSTTDSNLLEVAASADDYGWALGSMIYEANVLPYSVSNPFFPSFIVFAALFGVLVCAVSLYACGCCKWCRRRPRGDLDTVNPLNSVVKSPIEEG